MIRSYTFILATLGACAIAGGLGSPVSVSAQEIVQPLPPKEIDQLNAALQRLARNAGDIDALLDAGEASLLLDDVSAAEGFFQRAETLSPRNPRVMLGMARAAVRARDPLKAIGLFETAKSAGADMAGAALDMGLAYDLVGDSVTAQEIYRAGLARAENDEVRRRLSLSLAISGDKPGFQTTLNPLVARGDSASYRTRAFGLAILGEEEEAVEIAGAVMPREMSSRIEPYLRYMKRLTPAQQAAAGNLGVFPRAAQIGRDTPEVAQYREQNGLLRTADARLAPQGEPLGGRTDTTSQRRRPDRGRSVATAQPAEPAPVPAVSELPESVRREVARAERARASDPLQRTSPPLVVVRRVEREEPQATVAQEAAVQQIAASTVEVPAPSATVSVEQSIQATEPAAPTGVAVRELPATTVETPAVATAAVTAPGFDLASVAAPAAQTVQPVTTADVEREPASVAEAFAAFAGAAPRPVPASGGVDITSIKPPREVEKPAPPPVAKPAPKPEPKIIHPSRHWVQIATGKDIKALGFDWRRFAGKAPDVLGKLKPQYTPWGEANRLLAGPYPSAQEARKALNSLKEKGVDGFTYTSPEGQEIKPLR